MICVAALSWFLHQDEQVVHVKGAELIIDVFESCGAGGHLGELETADLQASGRGLWGQGDSRAACLDFREIGKTVPIAGV